MRRRLASMLGFSTAISKKVLHFYHVHSNGYAVMSHDILQVTIGRYVHLLFVTIECINIKGICRQGNSVYFERIGRSLLIGASWCFRNTYQLQVIGFLGCFATLVVPRHGQLCDHPKLDHKIPSWSQSSRLFDFENMLPSVQFLQLNSFRIGSWSNFGLNRLTKNHTWQLVPSSPKICEFPTPLFGRKKYLPFFAASPAVAVRFWPPAHRKSSRAAAHPRFQVAWPEFFNTKS